VKLLNPTLLAGVQRFSFVLNLEPLELRRLKNDLMMHFKCLNNLVALPSDEYFCKKNHAFHTRSSVSGLIIPLCSINHLKNDFFDRCLNCYNNLPTHVVNANSVFNFKKLLNQTDLSTYLHFNYF